MKKRKSFAERLAILDKIASNINETYGEKIVGRIGNDEELREQLTIHFIPTPSADINNAIGGGFPRRRCTIIAGKPDSGKTGLVLETIAYNMKKDPEFLALWIESENSLRFEYIVDTFEIDPNRFFYVDATKIENAEKVLDKVYSMVGTAAFDICCINSLKCLIPKPELDADFDEAQVAVQARLNSRMTRKFTAMVSKADIAFILITHLMTDIGKKYGDPLIVTGGHAIAYWSSLTLDLRQKTIGADDIIKNDEGIKVGLSVRKNHVVPDRFPYVKLDYYAIFGQGIETVMPLLSIACKKGICECKGAWVYWYVDGEIYQKWNGKKLYRQYMLENPEEYDKLMDMVGGEKAIDTSENMTVEEIDAVLKAQKQMEENAIIDEKPGKKKKSKEPVPEPVAS